MPVLESTLTVRLTLDTTTGVLQHRVEGSHPWQKQIHARMPLKSSAMEQWFANLGASVVYRLDNLVSAKSLKIAAVEPEVVEKILRDTETGHPVAAEARMILEGLHEFYGDTPVRLPKPGRDYEVYQGISTLDSKLIEQALNAGLDAVGFQLCDAPLIAESIYNNLKVLFGTSILRLGERSPDDE